MNISWGWFIVYLLVAGGFVTISIGALITLLAMPNMWLTVNNKIAKYIATFIFASTGVVPLITPWHNGVANFSVLQWIVAISLSITITLSYGALIGAMYNESETVENCPSQ